MCTCPQTTGCVPQPCTGCACCNVQPVQVCNDPSGNTYMLRYFVTGAYGGMTFIGNTLGLSKISCTAAGDLGISGNNPGTTAANRTDSIGAFITTNAANVVNNYVSATVGNGSPGGTTLDWTQNASTAVLNIPFTGGIPAGNDILRAELIWSGSYGYFCEGAVNGTIGVDPACILIPASNTPVKFTTPDGVVHNVLADPATAMQSQNPSTPNPKNFLCGGNYVRSQDVTQIVRNYALANGTPNGTYTVGGVPATIAGTNNTQNAAGWTLAVIYQNPPSPTTAINNMTLFISNQQASTGTNDAEVSGFCAAPVGTAGVEAKLFLSAIETDSNKAGDQMLFGLTTPLTLADAISGPNNPVNNFFASQINGDNGALVTTGTYGTLNGQVSGATGSNQDPTTGALANQGRQGYDITTIDVSPIILPGSTTAFARATTAGDDYMVNALGLQISVIAPVIIPVKKVNGQDNIISNIGDIVTFTVQIQNTGDGLATNVQISDTLETGLVMVPGSFNINNQVDPPYGQATTQAQLQTGVLIGDIPAAPAPRSNVIVTFQAQIVGPPIGDVFENQARTPFQFNPCDQVDPLDSFTDSNIVTIRLPETPPMPPPTNFVGRLKKCPMMNRTVYSLVATWDPVPLPTVVGYLILKNGVVVASIPATGPYIFEAILDSRSEANQFSVVAQYQNGTQSAPLNIRIIE
ncbi:MAG: DUF11 domain-containing protein [Verrucomicrobia bacterium]|nr:DUF11 domain-containing protein [Verrucomicrobiota bacterium]